ncbi:MAG: hypothetical protein P8X74_11515 [Reinekea sp.]
MLPKNRGAPAILKKQIEIKLLHPASTEEVTDSDLIYKINGADADSPNDGGDG